MISSIIPLCTQREAPPVSSGLRRTRRAARLAAATLGDTAAGIAAINSIGNLAGFLSPYLIGVVKDATGEATFGLYVLAAFMLMGAVLSHRATSASWVGAAGPATTGPRAL